MIRNTWKNIKTVHKEKKNEVFSFQDSYSFAADFLLQEKKIKMLSALWKLSPFFHPNSLLPILPRPVS